MPDRPRRRTRRVIVTEAGGDVVVFDRDLDTAHAITGALAVTCCAPRLSGPLSTAPGSPASWPRRPRWRPRARVAARSAGAEEVSTDVLSVDEGVDVQQGRGAAPGAADAGRPRVFDPDTGEVLGDAQPAAAASGPPRQRRTGRARTALIAAMAIALGLGAAVGAAWQRHRDTVRDRNEVHLSMSLVDPGTLNFSAGTAVLPVSVANSGSLPFTVTSLSVSGDGVTGKSVQRLEVAPGASEQFVVGLPLPCGAAQLTTLGASAEVTAAGGSSHTVTAALDTEGASLVSSCSTDAPFPGADAVVSKVSGAGPTFTVAIRLTLPRGTPASKVSVTAVPFTADPAPAKTVDGTAPSDITLTLNALNACARSSSWDGLPTSFTVITAGRDDNQAQTDLTMPYSLYRGLIHAVDTDCPA